jgi:hypothetical protein
MEASYLNKISRYLYLRLRNILPYKSINGWLTPLEAIGLYKTAHQLPKNSVVVEIGSWQGKSTFCLAKGIRSGKIYAIDPFNADAGFDIQSEKDYLGGKSGGDLLTIFQNNIKRLNMASKIVAKKGYSYDFPDEFNSINFLFIDGDHSIEGCKNDYKLYAHKVVKGGFIAFHDYYKDRAELGPTHVINQIINKSNDFVFYKQYDSLWVGVKS